MDKPANLLVSSAEWQLIRQILQAQLPGYPVWAFGSRVNGPCKAFSDLDLAIISQQPLPLNLMAAVAEAFSDSDLPYKVDLLGHYRTLQLHRRISAHGYRPSGWWCKNSL